MKFGLTEAKVSVPRLKPWTINEVKFTGVDYKEGTASSGNKWQAMQFNFQGKEGTYSKMFFCPNESGFERRESTYGPNPSDAEALMESLKYICDTLAKEAYNKVAGKIVVDLPDEFNKLYEYIAKILKGAIGSTTNIKLIADNKGYATIPPFAVSLSKSDETPYISNRWLGDNLSFTASELKRMNETKNEKPSEINDIDASDDKDSDEFGLGLEL